ncbi:MAG: Asp-tRNA(Asn)/Glu-tRNA(Gln) amidotransferase subunit GatC [Balneolales bacterium]|nr:Asp-tRNA(Asn)/Glu-tRNA(Gln) amidotransferase subunit GatC [Balneolales bacterium]
MSISKEEVLYVANLARLRLSDEESAQLAEDMSQILGYMELLNQVDTDGVEPLEHVVEMTQNFREDKALPPLNHETALKNAPDADSDYFRVPRVIE